MAYADVKEKDSVKNMQNSMDNESQSREGQQDDADFESSSAQGAGADAEGDADENDTSRKGRGLIKTSVFQYHEKALEENGRTTDLPRPIYFGWKVDKRLIVDQRKMRNLVQTARYTDYNWVPMSLFYQMSKVANIYFIVITLLAFIPGSPKSPYFSILTLAIMLGFLVLKDGQEDKQRRAIDRATNLRSANCYQYGQMGFVQVP